MSPASQQKTRLAPLIVREPVSCTAAPHPYPSPPSGERGDYLTRLYGLPLGSVISGGYAPTAPVFVNTAMMVGSPSNSGLAVLASSTLRTHSGMKSPTPGVITAPEGENMMSIAAGYFPGV